MNTVSQRKEKQTRDKSHEWFPFSVPLHQDPPLSFDLHLLFIRHPWLLRYEVKSYMVTWSLPSPFGPLSIRGFLSVTDLTQPSGNEVTEHLLREPHSSPAGKGVDFFGALSLPRRTLPIPSDPLACNHFTLASREWISWTTAVNEAPSGAHPTEWESLSQNSAHPNLFPPNITLNYQE